MPLPKTTPWGPPQHWTNIAEGIDCVSTAGHGGIKLSRQRQAKMPAALKLEGGWYEEDVEYNRVVVVFPECFKTEQVAGAHAVLKDWCPDEYAAWSGQPVAIEDSHVLRERIFREKHKNDYMVMSAWGDWKEGVPKGMVGVFAGRGGRTEDHRFPGDCKYFLVPAEEYQTRKGDFVIDLTRHKEIPPIN
jgi:hypothetical protein